MPKKKSTPKVPSNKYGISNLNFGRPGFSLEAPSFGVQKEEAKTETKATTKKSKSSTTAKETTTAKVSTKTNTPKFNKKPQAVPKMAIRKAAGRGK